MWRYFDKLPDFAKTLNDRVNRSIGMAPSKVERKHVLKLVALKQRSAVMKERSQSTSWATLYALLQRMYPSEKDIYNSLQMKLFQYPQCSPLTHPLTFCAMKKAKKFRANFLKLRLIKYLSEKNTFHTSFFGFNRQ